MECKECLSAQPRASHGVMTDAGLALRARLAKIQVTISSQIPTSSWVTVLLGAGIRVEFVTLRDSVRCLPRSISR